MKARLAVPVALLVASSIATPAQRLSRTAIPDNYDIHLAPDFATDTFAGTVTIAVRLAQPARAIVLHAAEIEFHGVTITAGGSAQDAAVTLDAGAQTATLTSERAIPAGAASIAIRYTGRLNDQLRGFYLSRANGREYAITQLEPTDARRAFPSFDEPSMKATFSVSATIDARDTAVSNGRLISDTPVPGTGKHTLRFATTKRMSPYLVALAVGDWECVRGGADGIPVRVCGTPNRKDQLGFALESAEFALRYFNRYFTIDYPFDKLDIVAVPDFSAGAMENTGAIFFREQFLLVPRNAAPTGRLKQVAQFVGHEIAHQWFGDLVTMEWWDDIWLNEGFATWMEYRPMQEWKPEWNAPIEEVRATQRAMGLDSMQVTRAIRTPVRTPAEINEVFDALAYQKTGAVVRMVEGFVGAAQYRDAINAYLKKFAFANATGEGFWTTVAAVTKKPVDRVLASFITQRSMPLVSVETRCAGGSTDLTLSQRPVSAAAPHDTLWEIPVCYKREVDGRARPPACVLLSSSRQDITLDGCSSWVFANVDGRGYYRASYEPDDMRALGEAAVSGGLNPVEQTTLLEDLWTLVRLENRTIAEYLSLSDRLAKSGTSPALATALQRLNFISEFLVEEADRSRFEAWVRQALGPLAARLGWTPAPRESDDVKNLRSAVFFTLGSAGRDAGVLREAARLVHSHIAGTPALDPSMVDTALQLAAVEGGPELYERYLSRMKDSTVPSEQQQYLAALSFFTDAELRRRTLAFAMSPDIRTQDAPTLLRLLMRRPASRAAAWQYLKDNWAHVERSFGIFQGIPTVVGSLEYLCDPGSEEDVETFFTQHHVEGIDRTLRQALEGIGRCAATRSAQATHLSAFLAGSR